MLFRKDINGLRAMAIIAVLLFHFDANLLPGGFAGVDVFFVISGYLMTSIIFNGIEQNRFTLSSFYSSRTKRILPPLAILCISLLIFGWINFSASDYRDLAKHAASSIAFVSNFIYANETGYFTASVTEKWLLHTWSLSLEWQFYMLYPLLILGLKKRFSVDAIKLWLVSLTLASFMFGLYMSSHLPEKAFFHLPFRAWELLFGGLLFLYPLKLSPQLSKPVEVSGMVMILLSYLFISSNNAWPSYLTLLPVFGASMIIIANRQESLFTNNLIMQKLGSSSYSIYLWHWPVCIYLYQMGYMQNSGVVLMGILASLILGWLSYKLIEQGKITRYLPTQLLTPKWLFTITLVAGIAIYQLHGITSEIRPYSTTAQAKFLEEYEHFPLQGAYLDQCNAYHSLKSTGEAKIAASCNHSDGGTGGVMLWGDSHAQALSLGLRETLPDTINFYQVASSGCKPSLKQSDDQSSLAQACNTSNQIALETISRIKPDIVIIAQANHHEDTNWEQIEAKLAQLGAKETVLIGPVPQWRPSLPYVIAERHWQEKGQYITDQALDNSIFISDDKLDIQTQGEDITYISLVDRLCMDKEMTCLAKTDKQQLLVFDYGHLTQAGSRLIAKQVIVPQLIKRLSAKPGYTFEQLAKANSQQTQIERYSK